MCIESDWKLFRKRLPGWQGNYMATLLEQYKAILEEDTQAAERFHKLEDELLEHRKDAGVLCEMRRSRMFSNILCLIHEGAITQDDLEGFSEELRKRVAGWLKMEEKEDSKKEVRHRESNWVRNPVKKIKP
ncbi:MULTISPECIES: multidrug transporter [unclassified Acidaminococcus]|uniref:multidrug transporter n=1 Tax=unclassified Acidaminococcus TaxID=2635771 RepID=UPI003F92EE80